MALTTYYFTVCPEALVGSQPLYLYTSATLDGSKLKATVYSGPAYLTLATNTTYSVSSNTNTTYVWVSTNSSTYEDNGYAFAEGDKYMYFDNLTTNPAMSIVSYIEVRGAMLIDQLKIGNDLYDITLPGIDGVTKSVNADSTHRDLATAKAVYDAIGASGGGTVTSVRVQAGTGLVSSQSTAQTSTLDTTISVDSNYKLQTNNEWQNSSLYSAVSGFNTSTGCATSGFYKSTLWSLDDISGITTPYNGMKIVVRIPVAGVGTAGALLSIDDGANYHPIAYNLNTAFTTHYPVNTNKVFVYNATQTMTGYLTMNAVNSKPSDWSSNYKLYYRRPKNNTNSYAWVPNTSTTWDSTNYDYSKGNTATTFTGVWQGESNYDSNTTVTYGTLAYYFRPYAAQAIYRYKLVALDHDNRLVPISTTNLSETAYADYASSTNYAKDVVVHRYANSVSKWYKSLAASNKGHAPESSPTWWSEITPNTPTSLAFRPDKIYWYNTTATINAGAVIGGNTLVSVGYNCPYMAYCNFNTGILAYRVFYLCGTYNQTTGLFTLRDGGTAGSKLYYTTAPTNTANLTLSNYFTSGYDYILVGGSYSSNNYTHIREDHPMFHFDGTNLVPYDTWLANTKGIGTVTSVNNVTPVSGNVTLTIPTLSSSGNGSITDGTTTLTFGSNAFNSTTIPTSYVSSVNGSTGAITNVITENDLVSGNKTVLLHEVEIPGDKPVNMCYDGNNESLRISDTTTLQAGPGFEFSEDAVRIFEETSTPGTYSYSPVASHLYVQTQLTPQLRTYTTSANNRFRFNIGNLTNIQGLGIFSFGNCNTMINLYGLTLGTTYKQVGTFIYNSSGSVITTTINIAYVQVDGSYYLDITSGNSNYPIINGYTGYLFTLKLY